MKQNLSLIAIMALSVFASCSKEDVTTETSEEVITISADLENQEKKTSLSSELKVLWDSNDKITIFNESNNSATFSLTSGSGSTSGHFSGTISGTPTYAVYPSSCNASKNDNIISFTIPQTQTFKANSFGADANIAVASINGTKAKFKNVCGILKLKFTSKNGIVVKQINLSSTAGHPLSGSFKVDVSKYDGNYIAEAQADGTFHNIVLDCGEGVKLSSEETVFYIITPVGALQGGISVSIITPDNTFALISNNTNIDISRSEIQPLKAKEISEANYSFPEEEGLYVPFKTNQYFSTNCPVIESTKIEIKMSCTEKKGKDDTYALFGVRDGAGNVFSSYWSNVSKVYLGFGQQFGAEQNLQGSYSCTDANIYTMTKDVFSLVGSKKSKTIDGGIGTGANVFTSRLPLYVGTLNENGSPNLDSAVSGNFYYVKQWEGDNLVFDGIAIYTNKEKTKRGMFDKISNRLIFEEN